MRTACRTANVDVPICLSVRLLDSVFIATMCIPTGISPSKPNISVGIVLVLHRMQEESTSADSGAPTEVYGTSCAMGAELHSITLMPRTTVLGIEAVATPDPHRCDSSHAVLLKRLVVCYHGDGCFRI